MKPTQLQIMQVLSLFTTTAKAEGKKEWMAKPFSIRGLVAASDGISAAYLPNEAQEMNFPALDLETEVLIISHLLTPSQTLGSFDANELLKKMEVFKDEHGGCRILESVFGLENLQKLIDAAKILENPCIEIWSSPSASKASVFGIGEFRFMLMPFKITIMNGTPVYDYLFKMNLEDANA